MPQTFDQRDRDTLVGDEQCSSSIEVTRPSLREQLVDRVGADEASHGRSYKRRSGTSESAVEVADIDLRWVYVYMIEEYAQ